jgi:hypothetical protein
MLVTHIHIYNLLLFWCMYWASCAVYYPCLYIYIYIYIYMTVWSNWRGRTKRYCSIFLGTPSTLTSQSVSQLHCGWSLHPTSMAWRRAPIGLMARFKFWSDIYSFNLMCPLPDREVDLVICLLTIFLCVCTLVEQPMMCWAYQDSIYIYTYGSTYINIVYNCS